jgi:phosphoribosylamine--glycine ligase
VVKVLLIGNGGREHCIAETLCKNREKTELFAYMSAKNPGIVKLSSGFEIGKSSDVDAMKKYALKIQPDFVVVGPELPLSLGIVDVLDGHNIPCIGPTKELAKLETSKSFTRLLMQKYRIDACPKFKIFENLSGINEYLEELREYVIKPDGLTGGKGVKVFGEHIHNSKEAIAYCREVLAQHASVIVEEKLEGEEFSYQCIVDGKHVIGSPLAQDHKRAFENDMGPNTGGMGSYSCENHLLPFVSKQEADKALEITEQMLSAINKECGEHYRGIMYGGFIVTKGGVKLIEYNARFGDPEAMNVLPILESDFVEMCFGVIEKTLNKKNIKFQNKATVCKYVVPISYPESPVLGEIRLGKIPKDAKLYYASVDEQNGRLILKGSRTIAFVGIADTLNDAEKISENAIKSAEGPIFHRSDIGTDELIQKRINHMKKLRMENG